MVMTYARRAHLNGNCANTRLRLKHLQMIEALERTGSIGKAADEFQIEGVLIGVIRHCAI